MNGLIEFVKTLGPARIAAMAATTAIRIEAVRLPDGARLKAAEGPAAQAARIAGEITSTHVGRTVAAVERELILDTLKHCLGNRTHAANILGISIRTLRNKLNEYMSEGYNVPAPASGIASSAA